MFLNFKSILRNAVCISSLVLLDQIIDIFVNLNILCLSSTFCVELDVHVLVAVFARLMLEANWLLLDRRGLILFSQVFLIYWLVEELWLWHVAVVPAWGSFLSLDGGFSSLWSSCRSFSHTIGFGLGWEACLLGTASLFLLALLPCLGSISDLDWLWIHRILNVTGKGSKVIWQPIAILMFEGESLWFGISSSLILRES